MLITNKQFLEYTVGKKLLVAFDISGAHPSYVATMHGLTDNCLSEAENPIMLTFDTECLEVSVIDHPHKRMGGTDIELCIDTIKSRYKPDVVLYVTDGFVCWPKNDVLVGVEQYVHLLDKTTSSFVPDYVKMI